MQAGVWDVDGTGMQAIDDPQVDLGIRKATLSPFWLEAFGEYLLPAFSVFLVTVQYADSWLSLDCAEGHQLCLKRGSGYIVRDGALYLVALLNLQRALREMRSGEAGAYGMQAYDC